MSALYHLLFDNLDEAKINLGDIANIVKGQQINGELLSDSGKYYVMNGGIEPSGYYHTSNTAPNTISISEGGNSCGYVQWNNLPFWSGGHCYTLQSIAEVISNRFLYHFLKWKEDDIMKLRIGSGLPNIQKKDLFKFPISIPSMQQQNKIETILDSVEERISVANSLLIQLSNTKHYLLHGLFI